MYISGFKSVTISVDENFKLFDENNELIMDNLPQEIRNLPALYFNDSLLLRVEETPLPDGKMISFIPISTNSPYW